nr:1,4-alpha-glucan branching protein GlgB [Phytohalomonas tamaricis]
MLQNYVPDGARPIDCLVDGGACEALVKGTHPDPFAVLGLHDSPSGVMVRTFMPGAQHVEVVARNGGGLLGELSCEHPEGVFSGSISERVPYLLRVHWPSGIHETEDPYAFGPLLGELDLHLISEGRHFKLAEALGAHVMSCAGVKGVRFAVWAPNARRVSVVGDFNNWDGRRHPMRLRGGIGVWELFIPRLGAGEHYKYELIGQHGELLPQKADPVARQSELAPGTASRIPAPDALRWFDDVWMTRRAGFDAAVSPLSIYEMHVGSWRRDENDDFLDWDALIIELIPYVADLGFTHIELLPISEHPFSGSWGYQPLGMFAPSSRFGTPEAFARFVNACHEAGIGIIVDWVPAHFPNDAHGLAQFDGTALYEYADPREGVHQDWDTLIYNVGRHEVRGFLVASALEWLERFHIDGLRVDAVASMLYRDYSRKDGEWLPNVHGGRENLEVVAFLRELNTIVAERCPGAMMIAEESTAWPGVTAPVAVGGLGFTFKWNMGWMHDTLNYMSRDPIYRCHHHHDMTFGMVYAFSERFILPLSHDEVVHGKGSLLSKMPGDDWQRLANLRAYLAFMWAHPGKKLLFMGGEIAQQQEWDHDSELDWQLLEDPRHIGISRAVADLNRIYVAEQALHARDIEPAGFEWVVGDDSNNSVFAFIRMGAEGTAPMLAVTNLTPVTRNDYRIGVPGLGTWREIFNSDSVFYGGSNVGNASGVQAQEEPSHGYSASLTLTLPPLSTLYLRQGDWPS